MNDLAPGGFPQLQVDRTRDMGVFDALPPEVRAALRKSPMNIPAIGAYVECCRNGVGRTLAEIAETVELWREACEREDRVWQSK